MEIESNIMCMFSLEKYLAKLCKKWTLLTLNEIGNHKKIRFNELEKELMGPSPTSLSSILKELQKMGLIEKQIFREIPPKVEYSLSNDGKEFRDVIKPLIKWASKRDEYTKHCNCSLIEGGTLEMMPKIKCADCGCFYSECKQSQSPTDCPNCTMDDCCCWPIAR